jgi:sugar transferase (PEP-CTERM/EpsH1 system associated)
VATKSTPVNILYLAHRIPYPPNKGDKIRSYHHLRHLARAHEVHLLAFVDDPQDEQWIERLPELCQSFDVVRLRKATAFVRGTLALACGRSLSAGYFSAARMRDAVLRACRLRNFDVAWAFSSVMAQYLPYSRARRRVVDCVDVDSEKWRQYASSCPPPLSWAYALEAARLRAFEQRAGAESDCVVFVTEGEASLYRTFCPGSTDVRVIRNGVDTAYFQPRNVSPAGPPTLLFTGALDYRPNVDAVRFIARRVLPAVRCKIPDACFVAVGHRPSRALLREAQRSAVPVTIAGSVPDVRPYFEPATVFVAPLRLGRGVQNKVLEAMAMGVPVVASPLATQGLDLHAGEHLLVAETEAEFADAVAVLLHDPQRRRLLADAALALVREHYRWDSVFPLIDACLDR